MIEITPELAQQISTSLYAADDESESRAELASQVDDAIRLERTKLADRAIELHGIADMARRHSRMAWSEFEKVSERLSARLGRRLGVTDIDLSALLRAQADVNVYPEMADLDDEQVIERMRHSLGAASNLMAGGVRSTDSVSRAVMDYYRDAAAKFVTQWAGLLAV